MDFGWIFQWVLDLVTSVFLSIWSLVSDFFSWCFEAILKIILGALEGLGQIPGVDIFVQAWAALPPDAVMLMTRFNLGLCSGIIFGALGIKFLLGLIPFVGLGR